MSIVQAIIEFVGQFIADVIYVLCEVCYAIAILLCIVAIAILLYIVAWCVVKLVITLLEAHNRYKESKELKKVR